MTNTLFNAAVCFAANKHGEALRKGTDLPYLLHPMEAATIVGSLTDDREILAAAVLHDVMEDADVTKTELTDLFGSRVAELVAAESENKRESQSAASTWRVRKEETIAHLAETQDVAVKMIALGDKLSNMRAIDRDYRAIGESFWNRFNQKDKSQHGWYYRAVADALSDLRETDAWKEYDQLIKGIFHM